MGSVILAVGEDVVIPLNHGKVVEIDDADWIKVNRYSWGAVKKGRNWYAHSTLTNANVRTLRMHRLILGLGKGGPHVDHKDGNGLNNKRDNLRIATRSQQSANRCGCGNQSGFKGVFLNGKKWTARIRHHNVLLNLGTFVKPEDAARRYDQEAVKLFKEFARLNFPK